jgi:hypothetical protein
MHLPHGTLVRIWAGVCLLFVSLTAARASAPAADSACSVPPYGDAYLLHGLNGGYGLGPWLVLPETSDANAGVFIGDANANGGGGGPGIACLDGTAWGFYANSGAQVLALRPFTAGNLLVGQPLSLAMDNGYIDGPYAANNVVELQLMNSNNVMRFGFHFRGGASEYQVYDADHPSFERGTGIPFTDGGLRMQFMLTGGDQYRAEFVRLANAMTTTITGTLGAPAGSGIDRLLVVHRNAGSDPASDSFFNDIAIVCGGQPPAPVIASDSPRCAGQALHLSAGVVPGATYAWSGPNGFSSTEASPVLPSVGVAAAGTYRVRMTLDGCTSEEATATVVVHPTPAAPPPHTDSPVCDGDTLHLFANADADTYTWSGPHGFTSSERNPVIHNVTAFAAGTYNLVVSVDGCSSPMGSTLVDVMVPQLVPPPDLTVECGASTEVSATGQAVLQGACGPAATVTHADIIEDALCPNVAVIRRVWTAERGAAAPLQVTQVITVVHHDGPMIHGVPADVTVECGNLPPVAPVTATDTCALGSRIPTNGLVVYYDLDETGTIAGDHSGRGNDGLIWNAAYTMFGFRDGCRFFDGHDDFIRVVNAPDLDSPAITVSAWVRSFDRFGTRGLFGKHQASYDFDSFYVYLDPAGLHAQLPGYGSGGHILSSEATLAEWSMVTMTYDGSMLRLYVNSRLEQERYMPGCGPNTLDLLVGAGEYGFAYEFGTGQPSLSWYGLIDEVRVYDRALSGAEVSRIFTSYGGAVDFSETVSGSCPMLITRTWSTEDACGNVASASQVLTVVDTQAPVLQNVPPSIVAQCRWQVPPPPRVTAQDACDGAVAVEFRESETYAGHAVTFHRTWTAVDACGNSTTAVQTIEVLDHTAPTLSGVPADIAVMSGLVPPPALVTAMDDCGANGDAPSSSGLVLLYTFDHDTGAFAYDESGHGLDGHVFEASHTTNGHLGGALYFDGVNDYVRVPLNECLAVTQFTASAWAWSLDPVVTAPARGLFGKHQAGINGNSCWIYQDAAGLHAQMWSSDGPDSRLNVSDLGLRQGWTLVTMTYDGRYHRFYIDGVLAAEGELYNYFGNQLDLLVGAGEYTYHGQVPNWSWHGFIDDVRVYNRPLSQAEITDLHQRTQARDTSIPVHFTETTNTRPATLVRTWTAIDASGNASVATQRITLIDKSIPVLSGQGADMTIACTDPVAFTAPLADAPCSPDEVEILFEDTVAPGSCPYAYSVTRTWTAIDACGNTSAPVSQTITVEDTAAPVLTAMAPDATLECPAVPAFTPPSVADNCDPAPVLSFTDAVTPGSCGAGYSITRTWIAQDACGNVSAPLSQTLSVADTVPPTISCPGNQTLVADCSGAATFQAPTAWDACDANVQVVCEPAAGSLLGPGTHVVTATATDACGNSSTCSFTVAVLQTLRVAFRSPVSDDNVGNDIETDLDVQNNFKSGSTIPHKVRIYNCAGEDVTAAIAGQVTVRLNVTQRQYLNTSVSTLVNDVPEAYAGVGAAGGLFVFVDNEMRYNLKTTGYPSGTASSPSFFRSHVTVEWNVAPGVIVAEEDAWLESK